MSTSRLEVANAIQRAASNLDGSVPHVRAQGWSAVEHRTKGETLRTLIEIVVRSYPTEGHNRDLVPVDGSFRATQVAKLVTDLLDSVGIELFELSMWQAWARSKSESAQP